MSSKRLCGPMAAIATAVVTMATVASAQYTPPGGMPTSSSPTYSQRSYGMNKAAVAGIAAAGAGGGLLLFRHFHHHTMTACVGSDGRTLDDGKDTYTVVGSPLTPSERIVATGKKVRSDDGALGFEVSGVNKDLGRCEVQSADIRP